MLQAALILPPVLTEASSFSPPESPFRAAIARARYFLFGVPGAGMPLGLVVTLVMLGVMAGLGALGYLMGEQVDRQNDGEGH